MHGSLSSVTAEVVTDASPFGRDFVAMDLAHTVLGAAGALRSKSMSLRPAGRCVAFTAKVADFRLTECHRKKNRLTERVGEPARSRTSREEG